MGARNYMLKPAREAKTRTSWLNPNHDYEQALGEFVDALTAGPEGNRFLEDFLPFQHQVCRLGMMNSLSQCLLKLTSPGVPDIYQGTELWDFSLVDPDNRRTVDYERRRRLLDQVRDCIDAGLAEAASTFFESMEDGRIKLFVIWRAIQLRREQPQVFRHGDYAPLTVRGLRAPHVCAYERRLRQSGVIAIAPRLTAGLTTDQSGNPIPGTAWEDTRVELPPETQCREYRNHLTGEVLRVEEHEGISRLSVSQILGRFPLALLRTGRSARCDSPRPLLTGSRSSLQRPPQQTGTLRSMDTGIGGLPIL